MQFEILKNPVIDFYSGFRGNAQGGSAIGNLPKNVGIDFYSGFRKKFQVYTCIVASGKKTHWGGGGGGVQFEILKKSGIDFYSGFRKTSQGGGVQF